MKVFVSLAAAVLAVSACDQAGQVVSKKSPETVEFATCSGSSAPSCRFRNSPVRLEKTPVRLPARALLFYPTAEEIEFLDAANQSWLAPPKTLTDGASIPTMFVSIVGNPKAREFANAAAVHDAYCGVGNEDGLSFQTADWRAVHRMFYDALRVGGTPEIKAKIMFAAVYIGGPRWEAVDPGGPDAVARDAQTGITAGVGWIEQASGRRVAVAGFGAGAWTVEDAVDAHATTGGKNGLAAIALRRILRKTKSYIETQNPSLPQIEAFAEAGLSRARVQAQSAGNAEPGQPGGSGQEDGQGTAAEDPATTAEPGAVSPT